MDKDIINAAEASVILFFPAHLKDGLDAYTDPIDHPQPTWRPGVLRKSFSSVSIISKEAEK